MAQYKQANRPIRVATNLGEDVLLLRGFAGEEGISMPYSFHLDLMSEEASISPDDVLRKPMAITVELESGEQRYIHGAVRRFRQLGQREGLTFFEAEIVPWLWFLSLSTDCRIFQDMDVLKIVETIFSDAGLTDYDLRCTRTYAKREYCVQYRESHLDFVSRLLEEEGIFYFFEHSDSKHTLVLADDNSKILPCPGQKEALFRVEDEAVYGQDVVNHLTSEYAVHVGKVTLQDYDFEQPSLNLLSSISGKEEQEIYEYHPRRYTKLEDGERYARLRVEIQEAGRHLVHGRGTCRAFTAGTRFALQEHYVDDLNQEYALVRIQHHAAGGGYRSWDEELDYRVDFVGIPHKVPYRHPMEHPRPRVLGTQTAMVVGPSGEEIWTDKYGRIKVSFYWDRLGKKDEKSSCWVRVATPWAGKGYGSVTIPRIGNEVVVDFLEGDPDQPLVVGSVYNADQMPPVDLPDSGIQMGTVSRSSPGGGGYNEFTVKDTKGEEQFTVNAQYDMSTSVGNDETHSVANNRTASVGVDETTDVGSNQKQSVGSNQTVDIGADQSLSVGGAQSIQVSGDRDLTVGGGNTVSVSADHAVSASSKVTMDSGADTEINAGANMKVGAAANMDVEAGANINITGGATIKLTAGGSSIEIGPGGVKITSPAMVQISAAMIKHNA